MKNYLDSIDLKKVPAHVAIIMDGNGRWAASKDLPRSEGHEKGAGIIEPLMDATLSLGIQVVSLYAFSTENWRRPISEVKGLWSLLEYFFKTKLELINEKGIRILHSGSVKKLPQGIIKTITTAQEYTKSNKKMVLNFCINYGGRDEIINSVNKWMEKSGRGKLTAQKLEKFLYTAQLPDVDLLIRTGGEYRISNFLLWQSAYAELFFTDVLWPDFKPLHLYEAIYEYQQRIRRFGGL